MNTRAAEYAELAAQVRQDAAQIAIEVGRKKLHEYEQSDPPAPVAACAAVQATYQEIAKAILEGRA